MSTRIARFLDPSLNFVVQFLDRTVGQAMIEEVQDPLQMLPAPLFAILNLHPSLALRTSPHRFEAL
jgi:hypothetical protein